MFSYEALDAIVAAKLSEHPRLEPDAAPDALGLVLVVDRSGWEARVSGRVRGEGARRLFTGRDRAPVDAVSRLVEAIVADATGTPPNQEN